MSVGMEGVGRAEARRLREQNTSHHLPPPEEPVVTKNSDSVGRHGGASEMANGNSS